VVLQKAREILEQKPAPLLEDEVLSARVRAFVERKDLFLACRRKHDTPLYVFDEGALCDRSGRFRATFEKEISDFKAFFAMKSNNHPAVSGRLVDLGLGLDVSSGLELEVALDTGCRTILFSGPGKMQAELEMACENRDRVTLLIDSFGELDRLRKIAANYPGPIRAGVRLTTEETGLWRKFGVRLADLDRFMEQAAGSRQVILCGLQFHTSWNLEPGAQVSFLRRLGRHLASMGSGRRRSIEFLDIGGGFWPPLGEWLHFRSTPAGRLAQSVQPGLGPNEHCRLPSAPIEAFAAEIGSCLRESVFPHVACSVFAEPGRWIVDDAMHILLTVADKKAEDLVIADAGTNIVGWERYESDYVPVINLSRPSLVERPCMVFGSLCTPHDVWGYGYFGDGIEPGDTLLIPGQGAYTYSLRQSFIKPLARVVSLDPPGLEIGAPGGENRSARA
jgi:diaminopimelate decarboxylase